MARLSCADDVLRELDLAVGADELRILGGRNVLGDDGLEVGDELLEVVGAQVGVALDAAVELHLVDGVLEQVALGVEDDLGEHLDEAAVAVPREALVAGLAR